jgi:hypothetical protein
MATGAISLAAVPRLHGGQALRDAASRLLRMRLMDDIDIIGTSETLY